MGKTPPKAPAIIAAAVLIAAPITASFEGLRTKPYRDPVGKATVCYGETERQMRSYTPAECLVLLQSREANDYAPAVLKCAPSLKGNALAASIDAAYNAGTGAFCRSPMVAAFNRSDLKTGCNAFQHWRVTANGKALAGLVRRRAAERSLCLRDVA